MAHNDDAVRFAISVASLAFILLLSSVYDLIVSCIDYLHSPVSLPCQEPENLTEGIEYGLVVIGAISFYWSSVFTGLLAIVAVIYVVLLCLTAAFKQVFSLVDDGKVILVCSLTILTIFSLPAPLFGINLSLFKCGTAYGILAGAMGVYWFSNIMVYVIEWLRSEVLCSPVRKVIVSILHVMELYAAFAVFAGLFDSYGEMSLSLSVPYIIFATFLCLATWLKNVLDNIHVYLFMVKDGDDFCCALTPRVADIILFIIVAICDLPLLIILSYDIANNDTGETEIIALVFIAVSLIVNGGFYAVIIAMTFMGSSYCRYCEDRSPSIYII